MVSLKYLSNFCRTPLANCEINLILTWAANCDLHSIAANQATTFAKTDTKLYVRAVTLSTDNNAELLQQLKLRFKRTIDRNQQ